MKVGDYVRTKSNGIQKIDEEGRINLGLIRPPFHIIKEEEILKSSPNIIDLIEVGDIIRGKDNHLFEVYAVGSDCVYINNLEEFILANEIKSIVTKEMFANAEYRVETN